MVYKWFHNFWSGKTSNRVWTFWTFWCGYYLIFNLTCSINGTKLFQLKPQNFRRRFLAWKINTLLHARDQRMAHITGCQRKVYANKCENPSFSRESYGYHFQGVPKNNLSWRSWKRCKWLQVHITHRYWTFGILTFKKNVQGCLRKSNFQ